MLPRRMDLEERKAFRGELVDRVVRESLRSLGVLPASYRFRVMPLDVRHHRFIAVIDVSDEFQPHRAGAEWTFSDIEELIGKSARERFRLLIEGVYWRAIAGRGEGVAMASESHTGAGTMHPHYQLISEEEKEALMQAIRDGTGMPAIHVGDREYQTDIAGLDEIQRGAGGRRSGENV